MIKIDNLKYKIKEDAVNIRKEPNATSELVGVANKNKIITVNLQSDDGNWYYAVEYGGWIKAVLLAYVDTSLQTDEKLNIANSPNEINSNLTTSSIETGAGNIAANGSSRFLTSNLNGIFGIPYQFMESVDRTIEGNMFGRKYAEKIIGRLPLLFLTPGRQDFLSNYSSSDAASIITDIVGGDGKLTNSNIANRNGRFYTFKFDVQEYYKYVNPMCNAVAQMLDIGKTTVNIGGHSAQLRHFDWSKAINSSFKSYFGIGQNIVYYVDGLNSVSESFSNDTRESSLAGTINGFSDTAKEIGFLVGYENAAKIASVGGDAYDATLGQVQGIINSMTNGGGIITNMLNGDNIDTILKGGKLIFPEMWGDSSSGRSYSINIKLRSPDADSLSVYLNIMVPYIHLLCMVLPHYMSPNSYESPFLIRAFYKGMFNIDSGIITDMSVDKGRESAWNDDGIPTEMDISLTIKDLYNAPLTVASNKHMAQIINNTAMMDYLCNMAGINIVQDEVTRKAETYQVLFNSKVGQFPNKVWSGVENKLSNMIKKLY